MSYRNKVYVCVEYDSDNKYYNTLKMWDKNEKFDFNFHNAHELNTIMHFSGEETIKRRLRERLIKTKLLIVLIGERTKYHHKYVGWEIKQAQKLDIPIIVVNLNKKNRIDNDLCPASLQGKIVVHIPFNKNALLLAMEHWPDYYHNTAKLSDKTDYYWDQFD
jgi:hypothetical protein